MCNKKWYVMLVTITLVFMVACGGVKAAEDPKLAQECASKLTEVMTCVSFATGKEATPEKKCCDSIKEMKDSNPACLCFLIQQIHNGTNPMLQKMKIQESRLLLLPSACKIVNASTTECPKLLKLPPGSPDAAIFINNATILPPTIGDLPPSTPTNTPSLTSDVLNYDAPGLVASILVPLAFLLAMSSTSVFRV
uniref:non-specific lipid transfer protein GPI-anchored 1-like n=1 Tax=Erigeron canadensis TaxID=72917 RepID=UPI001CB9B052|nr:non-specific lipid transfer protein GPI-anchored 1-like [Erigeron canadensis]